MGNLRNSVEYGSNHGKSFQQSLVITFRPLDLTFYPIVISSHLRKPDHLLAIHYPFFLVDFQRKAVGVLLPFCGLFFFAVPVVGFFGFGLLTFVSFFLCAV
jgi:hypothetical protein